MIISRLQQMAQVSKIIGPWWCSQGHTNEDNGDDHGNDYPPKLASIEGDDDDNDGVYDYAPAA
ncbi:hypothetical protein Hanom_Chr12g01071871 [Helianthus anomalus]